MHFSHITPTILLCLILLNPEVKSQINIDSLQSVAEQGDEPSALKAYTDLFDHHIESDTALAFQIIEKIEPFQSEEAKLLQQKMYGKRADHRGQMDLCVFHFKKAIELTEDELGKGSIYNNIGSAFYYNGSLDSAEYYLYQGYKQKLNSGKSDTISLAKSLNNLAAIANLQTKTKEALAYYQEAIDLLELANNKTILGTLYNNIGVVYQDMQEFDIALKFYEKSYEFSSNYRPKSIGNSCINLGTIYQNKEDYRKAKVYFQEAMEAFKQMPRSYDLTTAYSNLGYIEFKLENYKEAKKLLEEGLALAIDINAGENIGYIANRLATVYLNEGNYEKALVNNQIAKDHYQDDNNLKLHADNHKLTYEIYESKGEYRKALSSYKKFKELNDSMSMKTNEKEVEELLVKYQASEKDKQLTLQKLEISQKTKQRNFYFAGFLIISLFGIFLLNRYLLRQKLDKEKIENLKKDQKLLVTDSILFGQENERKRIAQDLHDGLGGLLSTARLQMRNVEAEIEKLSNLSLVQNAEKMINNAQEEVRRIAHDMMPDALVHLGLVPALKDLALNINLSNKIEVKTYFSDDEFDLSEHAELIIYRIIQEISTNTMKYAQANNFIIQMTENDGYIELTAEDDGIGFDKKAAFNKKGIGLRNIESRIKYLGGELDLKTSPNEGTSYYIKIPSSKLAKNL